MKEIIYNGNIFLLPNPEKRDAVCVTTNGVLRANGRAVMGAGIAKYARDTFQGVDKRLGENIKAYGNRAFSLGWQWPITATSECSPQKQAGKFMLLSFPTKHHWKDNSDSVLIRESCRQIMSLANEHDLDSIYMPCPGCSNGHLDYERDVRPVLMEELDGRFIVCIPHKIMKAGRIGK